MVEPGAAQGANRPAGRTSLDALIQKVQSGDARALVMSSQANVAALAQIVVGKLQQLKAYLTGLAAKGDRYAAEVLNNVERLFLSRFGQVDRWSVSVPLSAGNKADRLGLVLDAQGLPRVDAQILEFGL